MIGSTLSNVDSTLFQRETLSLYQRCTTLKIRHQILFRFQSGIKSSSPFFFIPFKRKSEKLLKKDSLQEWFKRLYGIVIRIYKLSSVFLPYCIYFVLFAKLKQCENWYKSQLSDGFTRKLVGLQLTYSHIRITLLQSTIMTFSGRFPKFLRSSIAIIFNNLVTKFSNVLNCCSKKRVVLVFMTQKFFV